MRMVPLAPKQQEKGRTSDKDRPWLMSAACRSQKKAGQERRIAHDLICKSSGDKKAAACLPSAVMRG